MFFFRAIPAILYLFLSKMSGKDVAPSGLDLLFDKWNSYRYLNRSPFEVLIAAYMIKRILLFSKPKMITAKIPTVN
jgi:hypothetical protein